MFNLISTPIQTDSSFLKIYSFSDPLLVENSINEVKNKLNISSKREVGFFSDEYKGFYLYGKKRITESQPLTPSLSSLLKIANDQFETDFNGLIVNRYETGLNYIERHKDSKNHPDVGVIIISYGATRNFRVFKNNYKTADVALISNEAIHMGGDFQKEFTHDLEVQPEINETRYSISFHKYMNLGRY